MDRMDDIDQAALLRRAFPSYGPAWDAAIDYGIDVSLLVDNLDHTPTERLQRLQGALDLVRSIRGDGGVEISKGLAELLGRVVAQEVDFVLVGGVASIAHGSATTTFDLDIAVSFTVENLRRVLAALEGLHPRWALTLDKRPVTQPAEELASYKNLYFLTDLGRLDILGSVPPAGTFEEVAGRAERLMVKGHEVRVISLEDLIAVKAAIGRPKDRQVELELRAIRELRAKR